MRRDGSKVYDDNGMYIGLIWVQDGVVMSESRDAEQHSHASELDALRALLRQDTGDRMDDAA